MNLRVARLRSYNILAKAAYEKITEIRRHLAKLRNDIRMLEDELYASLDQNEALPFHKALYAERCIRKLIHHLTESKIQSLEFI